MTYYVRNRACHCMRCRSRGLMGAAILVTLGLLFLLDSFNVIDFDRTWPVILLVIGGVLLLSHTGSIEGHVQPSWAVAQVQPAQTQNPPGWGTGTPPPPGPTQPNQSNDPQVKS